MRSVGLRAGHMGLRAGCIASQVTVEQIVRALMIDVHKNSGVTDERVKRKQEAELVELRAFKASVIPDVD